MRFSLHGRGRKPGFNFAVMAAFAALFALSSCSKFGRIPASEKGFTNVIFSAGRSRDVKLVGPPQDGGVVIWGVSGDGSKAFSLILENESEVASKQLPVGDWNFYATGWSDPSYNLEGTARCATASANLQGNSTTVTLALSPAACTDTFFGGANYVNGGSPKALRFVRCNALPASVSGAESCDGASTVGDFQSYQVSIVEHALGTVGTAAAAGERLTSRCFYPALSGSSSAAISSILVPAGAANGGPISVEVTGYTSSSCTSGGTTFKFDKGLAGSTVDNTFVGPFDGTAASVYLVHGPPGAPTSATLIAPSSNPGNSANPVVSVAGVAAGDTVDLFTDPTCSGGVKGSSVAAGSSVNVTISASLSSDGAYNVYAKRSNAIGISSCSSLLLTYNYDGTAPSIASLTRPGGNITNASPYTVSVTFSEAVNSFTATDISVTNGTAGGLSGSGSSWSFTVTPSPNTTQAISIAAGQVVDSAGNGNAASSTLNVTHDSVQPTVAVTTTQTSPFNGGSYPVTITFSESVSGFAIGNVSVTNGTKGNFSGSGATYTLDITPTANTTSTVSVAASAVTDAAGNPNAASSPSVSIVHDSTQPYVTNVTSSTANGDYYQGDTISIEVTFQEAVTVAGGTPYLALNNGGQANYASGSGTSTLTFTYAVGAGQTIPDLDYSGTTALVANGATLRDDAMNNANLTLVSPGATGSLGYNKALNVHGFYLLAVTPVYPTYPNWNHYVRFSNSSYPSYAQPSEVQCDGTETGFYGRLQGCLHSGELRKVIVTGRSSCANLSASDQNGVFDWKCVDFGGTQAKFFSAGFKPGKGLKHLVNASSWIPNKVTVLDGATTIGETDLAAGWGWGNTVQSLPTATSVTALDATFSGMILTVSSNSGSRGYQITADSIAVVTLPGVEFSYDEGANYNFASGSTCNTGSGTSVMFCADSRKFLWFEMNFKGGVSANKVRTAIKLLNTFQSRAHETDLHDMREAENTTAIELISSGQNYFSSTRGRRLGGFGAVKLTSSGKNRFEGFRFSEIPTGILSSAFITLGGTGSNDNLFYDFLLSNIAQATSNTDTSAIRVDVGTNNVITNGVISNIQFGGGTGSASGILLSSSATGTVISQVAVVGTDDTGIVMDGSDNSVVQYYTSLNNSWNGVYLKGANTNDNFFRSLALANHDNAFQTDASLSGAANVLRDSASGHNASFAFDLSAGTGGTFNVLGYLLYQGSCGVGNTITNASCTHNSIAGVTVSLTSAWAGASYVDTENTSDTGSAVQASGITDWQKFQPVQWTRAWSTDGSLGSMPNVSARGSCTGSDFCAIWDFTVPSGSPLYNTSLNGTTANPAFTTGACPVNGNDFETVKAGAATVLKHSVEIVTDDIGDNDGLCESGETCLFTPHIGAYQGTGSYLPPCTFSNGTLTGITLLRHSNL